MGRQGQDSVWQPVLTGALEERARETILAIADRLRDLPADWVPDDMPEPYKGGAANNPSLAGGRAGLAVFYAYAAQAWSRDQDRDKAVELLEEAIDLMAETRMRPSLYAGFAGVAWVTEHLQGKLFEPDEEEDPNDEIDAALIDYLGQSPWPDEYDVVNGLVGFGVYALERLPRKTAAECLKRVVDRLDETAEPGPMGVTWLSAPGDLPPHQREQSPRGHYNLGVAHGVPGVIALLGEACGAGVAREKARALLDGAVSWLLAQKLPSDAGSCFPYWVGPDVEPAASRSAWCYGDPGIAVTLLHAARCVGEPVWEREAIEIGRLAAKRPLDETGVVDAGLCHGAAGLGHIFNRMYQATGDPLLGATACSWVEHTLRLRRPHQGIAGFSAWMAAADGEGGWVSDPCFLTGAAGVGLALLAATAPIEPAWDRVLLTGVQPRRL